MLDLNECMPITLDKDGMEATIAAIFDNAQYFPLPPQVDIDKSDEMVACGMLFLRATGGWVKRYWQRKRRV